MTNNQIGRLQWGKFIEKHFMQYSFFKCFKFEVPIRYPIRYVKGIVA